MTFSTFFYAHKCPTMENKFYGCPDHSRQDEATFLVMWPSEPSQPLPSSSQTLLLTGQGAEFTAQRCPHSPLAAVPWALVTLVNSNSIIKSTSDVFCQLSLASPPTFPPMAFPVCLPMSWWSCMHSPDCCNLCCCVSGPPFWLGGESWEVLYFDFFISVHPEPDALPDT